LEVLALSGCIITIDAMGTQTAIAAQIHIANADYVLALKANHQTLWANKGLSRLKLRTLQALR